MYRILAANQPVRERRNQRSHPCYTKPELVATGPNQTWSWDITRLRGPKRWTSFYLYVLLDIFSRCVVGWMVADRENAALAATLIEETCLKQGIEPQVLTLHSDRGAPMTSKCTAQLLADLGVTRSLSRPQVSDDNPFSEAQFKTLKYRPGFPGRFEDITAAIAFCRSFFPWYNTEHRHAGIAMLTPDDVHHHRAPDVLAKRGRTLQAAWALLSLHQDKTRLVEFGRFADLNRRQRGVGKPATFDFLGLTHYCTTTLRGRFRLGRKPVAKRVNRTLARIDEVLRKRWHHDIWEVGRWLGRVCNGWLNYFAVPGSGRFIRAFLRRLQRRWMRALRRRSQRARFSWKRLERMTEILWPRASIRHPWPDQRFAVKHPR